MTNDIMEWARGMIDAYLQTPGRVLEVGARNVNGSLRRYLAPLASEYIGVDMEAGDGVDLVLRNDALSDTFRAASFDTVVCTEVLEHDLTFWVTVGAMRWLLKPGGHLLITTPANGFPYHPYPIDCYRFTEDTYRQLFFAQYEVLVLKTLAGRHVVGLARKP